ncbi:hypothetical protein MTR67_018936 [Solanum verrucosum]|uniref:Uncharacterized protein n=1 Tax=Solanum verrucosum TaxID=315347 RepID=A0AAF0TMU5_SOLVR|nr:hypothetical protein MTR67_018936 [Solanum verrucosum]
MMIMVTCVCIIRQWRTNSINTLNVRLCKRKTKHNVSLKGI